MTKKDDVFRISLPSQSAAPDFYEGLGIVKFVEDYFGDINALVAENKAGARVKNKMQFKFEDVNIVKGLIHGLFIDNIPVVIDAKHRDAVIEARQEICAKRGEKTPQNNTEQERPQARDNDGPQIGF